MTIDAWLSESTEILKNAGIESARLDALLIMEAVSQKDQNWILTNGDKVITDDALVKFNAMRERRVKREPLAYILGKKEFYGFDFAVSNDVLVPRPETEALVTYLLKTAPQNGTVIDVGTGSGCIAIATKLSRPDLHVTASDISVPALTIAKDNATRLKAPISLIKSNLLDNIEGKFNVIAANLPYVPRYSKLEDELSFEPDLALYADDDGLDMYEKFFLNVDEHLADGGTIIIEHDPKQFSWLLSFTRRKAERVSNFVTALR